MMVILSAGGQSCHQSEKSDASGPESLAVSALGSLLSSVVRLIQLQSQELRRNSGQAL
jgi:hypothetical protein